MSEDFRRQIERAKAGDRASLDRALRRVEDRVRRAASQRLRNPLRTQIGTSDVLQSTYIDVVRSIDSFRGEDEHTFANWLTSIIEHNLRDKARASNRAKRKRPPSGGIEPDDLPAPNPSPSVEAIRLERLDAVGRALDRLDPDYRDVIVLRMIEELSYAEIGERMGRSEGALRMLYARARAALALEVSGLFESDGAP